MVWQIERNFPLAQVQGESVAVSRFLLFTYPAGGGSIFYRGKKKVSSFKFH